MSSPGPADQHRGSEEPGEARGAPIELFFDLVFVFGLFVIIALGESIVAIGAAGVSRDPAVLIAAVLAVALAAGLWWAYFDVVALAAERRLTTLQGHARTVHARDSYTYLHFLIVAGIVLVALGIKKTLAHVDQPLDAISAIALCG